MNAITQTYIGSATYSPEDNKLRLYPLHRLDAETYAKVKAAGFKWAPRQELFVAPMWTPGREDLLLELCGDVDDEDTSLVDRAEQRAERFDEYSAKRADDARAARDAVAKIADNIPLGQPILVGHHSEKHARKDKERIESGMRKAVKMWRTSEYWTMRAAGALHHAKYKELPAVRARRIKGLEADLRKVEKSSKEAATFTELWQSDKLDHDMALAIANRDHISKCFSLAEFPRDLPASQYEGMMSLWSALSDGICTWQQAREIAIRVHTSGNEHRARWIEHYQNRLAYERAMLAEGGGIASDQTKPEKGGACKCWASHRGGWSYIVKVNRVSVSVLDNWGNSCDLDGSRNFKRTIPFDKLSEVMSAKAVQDLRDSGRLVEYQDKTGFVMLDEPKPDRPDPQPEDPAAADFDAIAQSLKAGVQVAVAPQLFPTPTDVARHMADYADIRPGHAVLEPSAGTGRLLGAMGGRMFGHNPESGKVVAVEINNKLAEQLRRDFPLTTVHCSDFLECGLALIGAFDVIMMNPPFERGSDIKHILHARRFLKPGGRLVAICANGPRQHEQLQTIATVWEELPADTFKDQGTSVRAALVVIDA